MDLADRMGIRIVKGKGDFNGGECCVNAKNVIVVNKIKPIEFQSEIIVEGLLNYNLGKQYLIPAVRSYIEDELGYKIKN